ncbi:MAG: hypothetical protein KBS60_04170 [Phascolarctobacterium sp.]|nr:hypothetical protein [Candidatus Phascolarctobacterium caballi]
MIFGWGGNGFAGNGGGAMNGYVLTSDFANIERKLDGVNNGICSLGYDQLAQMNGINSNIAGLGMQMQSGFNAANIATLQGQNALSAQLAQCCCDNRAATADLKYSMSMNTRDIVDNDNANYRAINERLTQMEMARKDERIAEQTQRINALELAASQSMQNQYLINQLRPAPVPAWTVPAPYCYQQSNNCGCC